MPSPDTQCHQHGVTWYPLYLQGSRCHTPAPCPTPGETTELLPMESQMRTTNTTRPPPGTDLTEESILLGESQSSPTAEAPSDQGHGQGAPHGPPLIEGLTAGTTLPDGKRGMPLPTGTETATADRVPQTPPPHHHREGSTGTLPLHLGQAPIKATGTPRLQQPPPPPPPLPPHHRRTSHGLRAF